MSEALDVSELLQIQGVKTRERKSDFVKEYWKGGKPTGVLCFP
jgi:hypothetical protein